MEEYSLYFSKISFDFLTFGSNPSSPDVFLYFLNSWQMNWYAGVFYLNCLKPCPFLLFNADANSLNVILNYKVQRSIFERFVGCFFFFLIKYELKYQQKKVIKKAKKKSHIYNLRPKKILK